MLVVRLLHSGANPKVGHKSSPAGQLQIGQGEQRATRLAVLRLTAVTRPAVTNPAVQEMERMGGLGPAARLGLLALFQRSLETSAAPRLEFAAHIPKCPLFIRHLFSSRPCTP